MSPERLPIRAARRTALALAAAGLLFAQAPAFADWNASASIDGFDVNFLVGSASGSYTWTTLREAWGATFDVNGSIPNLYTFQDWDGSAWPQASFNGSIALPSGGMASAGWSRETTADERASSGQTNVQGPLANGLSAGAFALYDFKLDLDANASVEVTLFESDQFVSLAHDPGDEGVAFAGFKLYAPLLGLDEVGGANQPYFQGFRSLTGGPTAGLVLGGPGALSHLFNNPTSQLQSHELRFEVSTLVFTTPPVPEPQTWALWAAGLAVMGTLASRRQRRAG